MRLGRQRGMFFGNLPSIFSNLRSDFLDFSNQFIVQSRSSFFHWKFLKLAVSTCSAVFLVRCFYTVLWLRSFMHYSERGRAKRVGVKNFFAKRAAFLIMVSFFKASFSQLFQSNVFVSIIWASNSKLRSISRSEANTWLIAANLT